VRALVLGLLLASTPAFAGPAELTKDFETANDRALSGDRAGAIALYASVLERGAKNEDVYFNLGNAYARDGRHLDAVIAYERALRLAPHDGDVKKNLAAVRAEMLGDAEEVPEQLGLADVVEPIVAPLPRVPLLIALLVLNALWVALLAWRKKRALTTVAGVLTFVLLALTAGHVVVARDGRGVVLESLPLKRGPNARYESRGDARAGARVRVVSEEAGWLEVQNADGTTGWLLAKHVERV
jgi:tetratricopeptide (TPR) repeat protein